MDMWPALDDVVVDARPGALARRGHGSAWSHIDVTLFRLEKRLSVRELAEARKHRSGTTSASMRER